ncbi:MAG TPA: BadF/BadG/BcrA/BcrD ATPase family protein [Rhabdochlamydiaceae bacterium]|nr:BadF/BadG/BcrA/BcrD ATPase family protein [Rhabdochlamydiaceae bacterium]
MKRILCIFSLIVCFSLNAVSSYLLCIDGGGTKTILQVVDQEGNVLPLFKNNVQTDHLIASGSNINNVGKEGVRTVLQTLFEGIKIGKDRKEWNDIVSDCQLVAGIAGVSTSENKSLVLGLFEEFGLKRDSIHLFTDADMALQLIENNGIILISGTGSVCFGKKDGVQFRVGGLGKILGDEGSGYHIGLQAFKAAMEEEYGWGKPTRLTSALKNAFGVSEVRSLIRQINLGEFSPTKIASVAPVVFEKALEQDETAASIIEDSAKELQRLLIKMSNISKLSNCEVHLWGGIFKNEQADSFIQKIFNDPALKQMNWKVVNQSRNNAALLYAKRLYRA